MFFSHMVSSAMNLSASGDTQQLLNPEIWRRHWGLTCEDSNPRASEVVLLQRKQTQFWDLSGGESCVSRPCALRVMMMDIVADHIGGCSHKVSQREAKRKRGFGVVLERGCWQKRVCLLTAQMMRWGRDAAGFVLRVSPFL